MPKVYKPKKSRKTKKKSRRLPPGWGYLVIGLVTGLGIGFTAYLIQTRVNQHIPAEQAVIESPAAKKPQKNQESRQAPPKSQFDFYTLLPEMEVVIPEIDELSSSNQRSRTDKKEVYILQAGSFRRFDEADSLKANLALIGIEANIQTVAINGEDTWYRVRIGPYKDFSQLRQARARLRHNDIEYIVLKMKLDKDE